MYLDVMFDGQAGNLPTHEDGPKLFWKYTSFTMTSSLKLSIMSYNALTAFDPAEYDFDLPTINTKLSHLFVLSNTALRTLVHPRGSRESATLADCLRANQAARQVEPMGRLEDG
jgi:hypothetical protein